MQSSVDMCMHVFCRETERNEFAEAKDRLKHSWAADRDDFARVKDALKKKNADHHIQNGRLSQALKVIRSSCIWGLAIGESSLTVLSILELTSACELHVSIAVVAEVMSQGLTCGAMCLLCLQHLISGAATMQESEAIARSLRELCIHATVPLPPELDGPINSDHVLALSESAKTNSGGGTSRLSADIHRSARSPKIESKIVPGRVQSCHPWF